MQNRIIAVIGGTGKSGKYLVQQLLKQGFQLRLLVRNPGKVTVTHPALTLIQGDARDEKSILDLLEGCTAVISTLGQPAGEVSIFSAASKNVVRAMKQHGIRRYILTTGLSVDTLSDHKSEWVKQASDWMYQHYPETTADKQAEYNFLAQCDIDWTLVRLPLIAQTDEIVPVNTSLEDCPGQGISAANLAVFLVRQLDEPEFIRKSPFLANA